MSRSILVPGDVLLDTNIVISFFANDAVVVYELQQVKFLVPSIVRGQLYAGARKSSKVTANLTRIDTMIPPEIVLSCDAATAHFYGLIKQALRLKGQPIPENDIWIASIALQYSLPLITRDAHFRAVEGLTMTTW